MWTCTPWSKKKFKIKLQKVHRAAQMDFCGSRGAYFLLHNLSRSSSLISTLGTGVVINNIFLSARAMDFLVELFRNLLDHPDWTMSQACTDSYTKTLKKWHGWLASSSFTV
jgi:CBS domain containing-hemolysin-like protein